MKQITTEHYYLAIFEYEQGMSLDELRKIIKHYEDLEQYEICQGLYLAVEIISFNILYQLAEEQTKKKIKVKWKSTKK